LLALSDTGLDGWFVLIKPTNGTEGFLGNLLDEIAVQSTRKCRIVRAAGISLADLVGALHEPPTDIVLLEGLEQWDEEALSSLDLGRSRLARPAPVVILLPPEGIVRLVRHAPNFGSWIGGRIAMPRADEGLMGEQERQAKLGELSNHYRVADADVIRMAEAGELPLEPHFVEWLILLGREDLAWQLGKRES
jgi:hypothetical protein